MRRAYNDRNHAPITTAPRLTVPETVPDRTVPSAVGPMSPGPVTTGRPVVGTWISRPSRTTLGAAGAVAIALVALFLAIAAGRSSNGPRTASSAVPASSPPARPVALSSEPPFSAPAQPAATLSVATSAAPPTPSEVPAIAATDLPLAPSIKPAPRPVATVKPTLATRATPPTATTPERPNCDPPYALDASGNKIWKPECLY